MMFSSIQSKLWFLVVSALLVMAVFAGVAIWGNQTMDKNGLRLAEMSTAKDVVADISRLMSENRTQIFLSVQHNPANEVIMAMHDHELDRHLTAIIKNRDLITASVEKFKALSVASLFEKEEAVFTEKRNAFVKEGLLIAIDLLNKGQFDEANLHAIKKINPLLNAAMPAYDALMAAINQEMQKAQDESDAMAEFLSRFLIVGLLVSLALLFVIAVITIRAVKRPIADISQSIAQVTQTMKFDVRLPARDDEFGMLVNNANHLFSQINLAVNDANRVLDAVARADFDQRVSTHYVGDLDQLKQGVNTSAISVSFMMSELEKVMQGLKEGKFDIVMDKQVPAAFRGLVESSLHSMQKVIEDVNQVMQKMSEGDFNSRVNASASGDLLSMKESINSSLDSMARAIAAISEVVGAQAQGDLTKALPSGSFKGQLHDLKNAINFSSEKVKEVVNLAISASNIVSDAASQVSQGSSDLSSRVQEQAAALEQTSATMHQMTSAVQANTENASKVAELAHQVQGQSNDGVHVMQQTIEAMKSIQQASNKIADIVSIIDSIAFQTNLLALNAAVEAARAGEHGRGFAVVASEVRALAGKSADAAKDIKGLIEDSVQRIDAGTKLADKSGEMLSNISESVKEVANMIEAISAASKEQNTGISQVHLAIADIDRVTQENAALVEETTAAAESLNHEANELRQNMSFFKTGQSNHSTARPVVKATANRSSAKALPSPKGNTSSGEWSEF